MNTLDEKQLWQRLLEGNKRFAAGTSLHPHQTAARRTELTGGQQPFAVIVGCSDSRVSPEIIFDQGLGDLFVVRVAGNIVDGVVLGSIEYAVEHLGAPLIVVLGHESCGAVTAAVRANKVHGHISSVVEALKPAVKKARMQTGSVVENVISANVEITVERLKQSAPILSEFVKAGKLEIIGAYYDLKTGLVNAQHPL